ncbi:spore coat protein U domain-containing protein [Croceibacterium aestuarii]|uniref:spore coat protein U domain-containing protein n=1 Tax=Croceibacterium aestuarii TaxID=3064139 RepID=UPI00272DE7CF|nr:spore coat protein U domain-containing protein [Croceibacterium sp. D39]
MKKIIIATAASVAFFSTAASAASSDTATLAISATVAPECSIEQPSAFTFSSVNINQGAGANALLLKNGSQGADSGTQNIYVSCNYAATIKAQSTANNGLLNTAGQSLVDNDPNDFTNLINYRIELKSNDSSFSKVDYRTNGHGASPSVTPGGAFHDNASLRVYIDRDDTAKRPVEGQYVDTATITLGAI